MMSEEGGDPAVAEVEPLRVQEELSEEETKQKELHAKEQNRLLAQFRKRTVYDVDSDGNCGPKSILCAFQYEFRRDLDVFLEFDDRRIRSMVEEERKMEDGGDGRWFDDQDLQAAVDAFAKTGFNVIIHVYTRRKKSKQAHLPAIQTFRSEFKIAGQKTYELYLVGGTGHFQPTFEIKSNMDKEFIEHLPVRGKPVTFFSFETKQKNKNQGEQKAKSSAPLPPEFDSAIFADCLDDLKKLEDIYNQSNHVVDRKEDMMACVQIFTRILMKLAARFENSEELHSLTAAILFFGSQSAGKSRLASAVLGVPVAFSRAKMATKAPVCYTALHDPSVELQVFVKKQKLNSVSQIAEVLGEIMDKLGDKIESSPIDVRVVSKDIASSISVYDMIGLLTGDSQQFNSSKKEARDLQIKYFRDKIAPQNASSVAVMVNRVSDEKQAIAWSAVLEENNYEGIERAVCCLTYGDVGLDQMDKQGAFKNISSLPQLWERITNEVQELLQVKSKKLAIKIPIFLTALDPTFDTAHIQELCKKGEDKMLIEYTKANAAAHETMIKHIKRICKTNKVSYTTEQWNDFMTNVGVENFVSFIRQKQLEAFTNSIPKLIQYITGILKREETTLNSRVAAKDQLRGISPQILVHDFFRLFALLYFSAITGTPILDRNSRQQAARKLNDGADIEEITYNPARPAPISWINNEDWNRHLRDNALTMREEIDFATNKVPSFEEVMPKFPFYIASMGEELEDHEERFVDRYDSSSEKQIIGVGRMKRLIREVCARLVRIDPGQLTKNDLMLEHHNESTVTSSFSEAINAKLSHCSDKIFKTDLSQYLGRRFAAIVWHISVVVLDYMKTIKQFNSLYQSPKFLDDVKDLLAKQYYAGFRNRIRTNSQDIAARVDTLIDSWSPMFYELAPLLMVYDKKVVRQWMESNPSNSLFTKLMTPITSNKSGKWAQASARKVQEESKYNNGFESDDETDDDESDDLNEGEHEKKGVKGLAAWFKQKVNEKFLPKASSYNWIYPASKFFNTSWSVTRMESENERSDTVMYLMDLSDCPDVPHRRESSFNITKADVAKANYVFQRMFKCRVFDIMRSIYAELLKNAVDSQDYTKLSFQGQQLAREFFTETVCKPSEGEEAKLDLLQDSKALKQKVVEKYLIEDSEGKLSKEILEIEGNIKQFRSLLDAAKWFHSTATSNVKALNSIFALKKMPLGNASPSDDEEEPPVYQEKQQEKPKKKQKKKKPVPLSDDEALSE